MENWYNVVVPFMLQYISNWNNFLVISCCVMLNLTRAEYFSEDLVEVLEKHSVILGWTIPNGTEKGLISTKRVWKVWHR